ncbi:hypothetical protein [Eubacterium oxidoreducens]|uniref:DUF4430 domain-containing protein n=1 Tax=Eubacterium oxidoreducens TaxID=1732 RepID=A0A1G6AB21_EUBOX|nr:hypothetical protein [Eubacterium oxidoreducens]SDB05263.1 hypothetical protein SAMN02910417_00334 [Eubacterium oxidoreducens]
MRKNKLTKLMAGVLSAAVVLSGSALMGTATAANAAEVKSLDVTFSVYDAGYVMTPTTLTVSADLDDNYVAQVGCSDDTDTPTVLDAVIAAHIKLYGEKFYETHPFTAPGGWTTAAFGKTSSLGYYVNSTSVDMMNNVELSANDKVEFFFYQDTNLWSDVYMTFDKSTVSTTVGSSTTLNLKAVSGYDSNYNLVFANASNVAVTSNGTKVGTTDSSGNIKLTFSKAGTYVISLASTTTYNGSPIIAPYCKVTVTKNAQTITKKSPTKVKKYKYSKTKKRTFKIKVKNAKTTLVYKSSSKNITVNKNGKVTIKKGTKKGTYKIKVYAKATTKYKKSNVLTFKIKIK